MPGGHLNVLTADGVRRFDRSDGTQLPGIGIGQGYAFDDARSFVFDL